MTNTSKKFRSGFAWVKYHGYSYIGKILKRDNDKYVIEFDNVVIYDVPEYALTAIRGDEDE